MSGLKTVEHFFRFCACSSGDLEASELPLQALVCATILSGRRKNCVFSQQHMMFNRPQENSPSISCHYRRMDHQFLSWQNFRRVLPLLSKKWTNCFITVKQNSDVYISSGSKLHRYRQLYSTWILPFSAVFTIYALYGNTTKIKIIQPLLAK